LEPAAAFCVPRRSRIAAIDIGAPLAEKSADWRGIGRTNGVLEEAGEKIAGRPMPNARLLIVEDEYLIRLLLEDMLTEFGCSIAAVAATLEEGKKAAETAAVDLAILDVNIDGQQVFPIADILKRRGLPFIFITGYGARGLPNGYRDMPTLQKPFQMEDLKATLTRVLPNA
jgi:CheY-like chemotaxis protein